MGLSSQVTHIDAKASNVTESLIDKVISVSFNKLVFVTNTHTKYKQSLRFGVVFEQLASLRQQLNSINPSENFVTIQGAFNVYLMSNTLVGLGTGRLKCAEIDTNNHDVISLSTFIREKFYTNKTIILSDRIIISEGSIKCFLKEMTVSGIVCLSTVRQWATAVGLEFYKLSDADLLKMLVDNSENSEGYSREIWHIAVNETHLYLSKKPVGYVICQGSGSQNVTDTFADVLNKKYFSHLSIIGEKILDSMWHQTARLQNAFLQLVSHDHINVRPGSEKKEMCAILSNLRTGRCFQSGDQFPSPWSNYFEMVKLRWVEIDTAISKILDEAKASCDDNSIKIAPFIRKVYRSYLSLKIYLENFARSYKTDRSTYQMLGAWFTAETSAKDAENCFSQGVNKVLNKQELIFFANTVYNSKLEFCRNFADKLGNMSFASFKEDLVFLTPGDGKHLDSKTRVKRWFFTSGLATVTGLATQENFGILDKKTDSAIAREEEDASEIVILDKKTNEILSAMRNQNNRVLELDEEEHVLHEKLQTLLKDEASVTVQLGHIIKALETLSDVSIEYSSLMSAISLMPVMIEEIEAKTLSVISGIIHPEMIPDDYVSSNVDNLGLAALSHARILALVEDGNFVISYEIPQMLDSYRVYKLKSIPFLLEDKVFHKFDVSVDLIAVNDRGYSFIYKEGDCDTKGLFAVCETAHITIHKNRKSCPMDLIRSRNTIPFSCVNSLQLIIPKTQDYVYHGTESLISISSPYNDTLTLACASPVKNKAMPISIGITVITLTRGCEGHTSELLIYPNSYVVNTTLQVGEVWTLDLSNAMSSLADDINEIHGVNTSQLANEFAKFSVAITSEGMDVAEVQEAVSRFNVIKSVSEYSPVKINPEAMHETTTTVTAWLVLAIIIWLLCSCLRSCTRKSTTCCFALLWKGVKRLVSCAWRKIRDSCSNKQAADQSHMELNQSQDSATAQRVPWVPAKIGRRLVLVSHLSSGTLYFNHLTGVIENQEGNELRGLNIYPTAECLNAYLRTLSMLEPPDIVQAGNEYCLADDSNILYRPLDRQFVHKRTNKLVYGYKLPNVAPSTPVRANVTD